MANQGRRILIVQDDAVEAGLLAFHLKQANLTSLVVSSTQEAWDAIGWGAPDVVVAELKTEAIDGLEVLGALVGKEVAAYLISDGAPSPEEELEALDRGVREMFTKPLDHRSMAQRIAQAKLRVMEEGDSSEAAPIRGWVEDHSVTTLLDMCRRLDLNARLVVDLPGKESGHLVIRNGKVIDGVRGDHGGKEAVFTVMTLACGRFTLTPVVEGDPLLDGTDRVRMDLASLLEAATRPRDRTNSPQASPRTTRRPRTKTGLTTLDEIIIADEADMGPPTVITEPPTRMQVDTTGRAAGPSTVPDAVSSHVAVDLEMLPPETDGYAPTYMSELSESAVEAYQAAMADSTPEASGEGMVFPDDDMIGALPSGPVDDAAPTRTTELVPGFTEADPYGMTDEALKALSTRDVENVAETHGDLVNPFDETEDVIKAITTRDLEDATPPADDDEREDDDVDDMQLMVDDIEEVDPLKTHHPTGEYSQVTHGAAALDDEESYDDDLELDDDDLDDDEAFDASDDEDDEALEDDDEASGPSSRYGDESVEDDLAALAPDVPMDHAPGPETRGAIEAAMPGYGRGRWLGRAALISLGLLFFVLAGLVTTKLVTSAPETSPADGLSTGGEAAPAETEETAQAEDSATSQEQVTERYALGNIAAEEGRIDEAMEHYREALGVDPDHAGSIAGLSATLIQAKRYEDARSMLEELLRVSPDEAGAHLNLGLIAHKTGDLDGRSKALNTFMELDPASPHRAKLLELLTGGTVDEEGGAPTGL